MIVLSNTLAETIAPGATLTFNNVIQKCGCDTCFRKNSGTVSLTNGCALYEVYFGANVTGATAGTPVRLAISIGGSPLLETDMIYTPAVANAVGNVSAETVVQTCCGTSNGITVTNTGTVPIIISPNPTLYIRQISY